MNRKSDEKIALVHDFLLYWGGAESTLKNISQLYPGAKLYSLLEQENIVKKYFPNQVTEASFLQKFPSWIRKRHRWLLPLMPSAVETFDLRKFDLIISSSSAFAKGIVVKSKIKHLCYMHAPMRYVWDWQHEYLEEHKFRGKAKIFLRLLFNYLRLWDRASANRPDFLVANSIFTQERIKKYYRRSSKVIYPPVEVDKFKPQGENKGYFLTVGRLSPYKRVDLLIRAFKKLNQPLIVVGEGKEKKKLEKMVINNDKIKLLGWVGEKELIKIYQNCRAFVCASEDDFNITAVEAMAAGKPVIALRRGGVTETVMEGVTGEFFDYPTLEIMADGIRRFIEHEKKYDYREIRKNAERFGAERFKREFQQYIKEVIEIN